MGWNSRVFLLLPAFESKGGREGGRDGGREGGREGGTYLSAIASTSSEASHGEVKPAHCPVARPSRGREAERGARAGREEGGRETSFR